MTAPLPLFHRAYGAGLRRLPEPIIRAHAVHDRLELEGRADVAHGRSIVARLLCRILRFPPAAAALPLHVAMERTAKGERWRRLFGDHPLETIFRPGPEPATIIERLWPLTAVSRLDPDASGVSQVLVGLRALGMPVPRPLWPTIDVREGADGSRYTFSMSITLPWNALLVHYQGWLETSGVPDTWNA